MHPGVDRRYVSELDRWPPPVKRLLTQPRYIALARLAEVSLLTSFGAGHSMIRAGALSTLLREFGATPCTCQFMAACCQRIAPVQLGVS